MLLRKVPMKRIFFVCLFLCLMTLTARRLQAQTETVLYSFTGGSDGANPEAGLTSDGRGNFYGTTSSGGLGYGTVFELSPNGGGGWNESVLHSFTGGEDGADPYEVHVIFDGMGNLYGTAFRGGANGYGVVWELSQAGTSWTETVLFSGIGYDSEPYGSLIMDTAGNLYGTSSTSVFELSPSGDGWTEQQIYEAAASGLTMDTSGNIFGTFYLERFERDHSVVFELSPDGNGDFTSTILYKFHPGTLSLGTLVVDKSGNIYGTTEPTGGGFGYGKVYELSLGGYETLHSFNGGKSKGGSEPFGGIVLDETGNIYGTTYVGGAYGEGTVYELVSGNGSYKEKVLWNFDGTNGESPYFGSLILDGAGNLYGTTEFGGLNGNGVVFEVTP
jgi:uncharacterized repeat protein (TIGR03803 family)